MRIMVRKEKIDLPDIAETFSWTFSHPKHEKKNFPGEYDERCLESDLAERCSLENNENNLENYNNCSEENYNNCSEENYNNCSEENYNNCSEEYSNECQNQYQDNDYSNQYYNEDDGGGQQMNYVEAKGPEIHYKSSKELYKAVAKQCGLQCKMTDTCR